MCRSYFSQTRSLRGTPPTHTQAARNQNEFKNNKARNHDLKRSRKPETQQEEPPVPSTRDAIYVALPYHFQNTSHTRPAAAAAQPPKRIGSRNAQKS